MLVAELREAVAEDHRRLACPSPKLVAVGGRLSAEVEKLRGVNAQLTANLAEAKTKTLEGEIHLQAALKSKETDASAAAAREQVLRAEAEQARTRADTMSQSLAEVRTFGGFGAGKYRTRFVLVVDTYRVQNGLSFVFVTDVRHGSRRVSIKLSSCWHMSNIIFRLFEDSLGC